MITIKDILIKKGWKETVVHNLRRKATALAHPSTNLVYLIQAHEFRAGTRTIAKISSRNVVYDTNTALIIVDGFIAIKP